MITYFKHAYADHVMPMNWCESKFCINFFCNLFNKRDIWLRFISFGMQKRGNFTTFIYDWALLSKKRINDSAFSLKFVTNPFSWKISGIQGIFYYILGFVDCSINCWIQWKPLVNSEGIENFQSTGCRCCFF